MFLSSRRASRVLVLDPEAAGPHGSRSLGLDSGTWWSRARAWFPGGIAGRSLTAFAAATNGDLWIGGFANREMSLSSYVSSDAYLARLDATGQLRWERSYGQGKWGLVAGIAATADGGAVIVGSGAGDRSQLVRVAADGKPIADRDFGGGKGASIVALPNGRFLIAGLASTGPSRHHDVVSWILDATNTLSAPVTIRATAEPRGANFTRLAMAATADGAYLASSSDDGSDPRPVEIARLNAAGAALWRVSLPQTITIERGRRRGCEPAVATLVDDDALVACAQGAEIQLYRLSARTGRLAEARLPLPKCQHNHPATLFLTPQRGGIVMIAASRPGNNVAANCSWMGRLRL